MTKTIALSAAVAAALLMTWALAPAGAARRSDSVVKVKAKLDKTAPAGKAVVLVTLDIQPGWHLYANPADNEFFESGQVTVKVADAKAVIAYPVGKTITDKKIGTYKVYENQVEIRATIDRPVSEAKPLELSVRLQSCDDKLCLQPATVKLMVP